MFTSLVSELLKTYAKVKGRVDLGCSKRLFVEHPAGRESTAMTTIAVTYGYARVSKTDDESKNLDTQLMLLARTQASEVAWSIPTWPAAGPSSVRAGKN